MAQVKSLSISPVKKSGSQYAAEDTARARALATRFSGTSTPENPEPEQSWIDKSSAALWLVKVYDGQDWIIEGGIDPANNWYVPFSRGLAMESGATTRIDFIDLSKAGHIARVSSDGLKIEFVSKEALKAELGLGSSANVNIGTSMTDLPTNADVIKNQIHNPGVDFVNDYFVFFDISINANRKARFHDMSLMQRHAPFPFEAPGGVKNTSGGFQSNGDTVTTGFRIGNGQDIGSIFLRAVETTGKSATLGSALTVNAGLTWGNNTVGLFLSTTNCNCNCQCNCRD